MTDFVLRNATLIIFVVVFVWFGLGAENFFGADNALNILKQASFTGIIAVGMTFVLLTAGIDLSVGSNMYVSAMTVGYFLMLPGMQGTAGAVAGIVVGLAAGAAFGAINAFSIVVLRITPFLATLATMVAGHGLVTAVTKSFGLDYPVAFTSLGATSVLGLPVPIIVFALVVVSAHVIFTRTQYGRQLYAVGNDLEGAKRAGIRTDRILFSVYVISGALRSAWRHHADRAGRAAQPDLRRRQGVRRHHRRGPRRDEPLRRRRHGLRRGDRLGPRPDGPGRHDLREGQPLPAADRARRHHLSGRLLRQPAGIAARAAEAAVHSRGRSEAKRGGGGG